MHESTITTKAVSTGDGARPLQVAVVGLRGFPDVQGGVERHCMELYPRLKDYGIEATVFARKGYVASKGPYEYRGVKLIPLFTPRTKSLEAIFHTTYAVLYLALCGKKFDLVHIHTIGPSLLAPLVKLLGYQLVITHQGPDYARQKWGGLAKVILRWGERLGARWADRVIAVAHYIKTYLEDRFSAHVVYISNGVAPPQKEAPGPVMAELGLAPGKYLIEVARIVPEKRQRHLIEAFGFLETDWKLVIIGRADHQSPYSREVAQKAAGTPGVVLAGYRTGKALAELYSNAGLFVLPSTHEGLPLAGLEAISYGLPIVLSDIAAHREIAGMGLLFALDGLDDLRSKLSKAMQDPESALGPGARAEREARLSHEFDWDYIAQETSRLFKEVCA